MAWFKKAKKPIAAATKEKPSRVPEGLWVKCPACEQLIYNKDLVTTLNVCPKCAHHFRINATERLRLLFDDEWIEYDKELTSTDPLNFTDTKPYRTRLTASTESTGLKDAVIVAEGHIDGIRTIIASMEYEFIGGSMGVVVGEKITRGIERALDQKLPVVIVCCSGGARMMEGARSLMQMAKISGALARLDRARLPYIAVLTDPTTGGVTASFAMLGDLNIAEPKAQIGFAGPRVIEQTIRQKLPEGFQRSEFLLEKGMIDLVVDRRDMKSMIAAALRFMLPAAAAIPLAPAPRGRDTSGRDTGGRDAGGRGPRAAGVNHLEYLFGLEQFGIKFGLDNIRAILDRLDHPERAFPSVHIAGTNGKGSVTAMVDTGLRAAGRHTGRYTSPHLIDLSERFAIDGRPVDRAAMIAAIGDVRAAIESLVREGRLEVHPTFFEATTAVAFELFRRAHVDVAVVEVGLGGRLDATNVLLPVATAITSIAFDHQAYLGSTLRAIALEKAGIIKPDVPVVVGDMDPEALAAIEDVAGAKGAPVIHAEVAALAGRRTALRGRHQQINAAIALGVLDVVDRRGFPVTDAAKTAAIERAEWPGRIDRRQLPGGRALLMDAAHNPAGARALAAYLRDEGLRPPLVFAAMRDKDLDGMFRALLPAVGSAVFTRTTNPRSADPAHLADRARVVAPSLRITVEPDLGSALERAWTDASLVLAAGSIFLLGDVMQHLGLHC